MFYEVAVRHAARKPIVHLITTGQEIPFDIANMRAVQYALDDPDVLEAAQRELERKVDKIEESDWKAAANPISAAMDVWLLQESEKPELREAGQILAAVGELRDEVRGLGRRVQTQEVRARAAESPAEVKQSLVNRVQRNDPITDVDLLSGYPQVPLETLERCLHELLTEKALFEVGGKLSTIPF